MRLIKAAALMLVAALALSACASVTSAPVGPLSLGSGYAVTLGRDWSDISAIMAGRPKKVRLLSIDGPLLNRLYLTQGLVPGDVFIKPFAKEKPTPVVREAMSANERIEFVADCVAALDYQGVETTRPRPATLGGKPALRFDITARTTEGLDLKGSALAASIGGKLYVILYLAPAEHYFQATLPEVEAIMASARVAG